MAPRAAAERRRMGEFAAIALISVVLVLLSRLETRLFGLSETFAKNQDFVTTVVYFGLINFNVILILTLGFLLFRNVAKLVVERRRGVFGSNLRTKLVATLVFFALAPTILFFYVSARFIVNSFDEWFSDKVRATMEETRQVSERVYRQDQRRLESLAKVAGQRLRSALIEPPVIGAYKLTIPAHLLDAFDTQYGLDQVSVYDRGGKLLWSSRPTSQKQSSEADPFVTEILERFSRNPGMQSASAVIGESQQDVVKGVAPLLQNQTRRLIGLVVAETRFETQMLRSIEAVQNSFANLRPGAQLIKLSYLILLIVMTLLVLFSAVWLGFYVARGITDPIRALAEGTREVALGNYGVALAARTEDETGQLVRSFNLMTHDLQRHRSLAEVARKQLVRSNDELDRRRKYMEVILKSITTGVIAFDNNGCITAVNDAAEQILGLNASKLIGVPVRSAFDAELYAALWLPVADGLSSHDLYSAQLEVVIAGRPQTLLLDGARIADEAGVDLGIVVIFDDATEKVKLQRIAAWREVARRIAHEIKNPVTPIKLSAQRLLRRFHEKFAGEDLEVFESCLQTILKQVDSLRDLVNEFSKFSRLPQVQLQMAYINTVIADVAGLYKMSYPTINFDTQGLGQIPNFPIDTDQMNRVFVNLVENAIAAIPDDRPQPKISFKSSMLDDLSTVRIEVMDNGAGIPHQFRDRVMEPYFSTKDGGTGLGLAIVAQIITDHGGYLRLLDNEPCGTRIVIELPTGGTLV
ncbi:MAG: HAMP domain-containing protein [Deltaproteobacteria bacterium]|nr:HAMP domain-containing protein [Deltaproteobacteria bacterium]